MHASSIVQRWIESLDGIHAARRKLLAAATEALMHGHALSLSRLARGVMRPSGGLKAALKRIDRLIGNARIAQEAREVGRALMGTLSRAGQPLVIAVDWSAVSPGGRFVELRAVLTWLGMGRGLTIYQQVYPVKMLGNPAAERALLDTLSGWISAGTEVIVLTDAGFRRPWFAHVEKLGWAWIGRVRGGAVYLADAQGLWATAATWFAQASARACRWPNCRLGAEHAWPCDIVLYRAPRVGRRHYRRPGRAAYQAARLEAQARAREPWLLAHSTRLPHYRPDEIVAMYARRMQIEENFRDSKSLALGMGLQIARSRSAQRLHALLLINTLAAFLLWHIGQLAEAEGLHRRFKATTRSARELSLITLGLLICRMRQTPLSSKAQLALERRLDLCP